MRENRNDTAADQHDQDENGGRANANSVVGGSALHMLRNETRHAKSKNHDRDQDFQIAPVLTRNDFTRRGCSSIEASKLGIPSMAPAGLHFPLEDFRVRRTFRMQDANQAALRARERMIDENVIARHVELEFYSV
jgi:hypothetical protein